MPKPLAASKKVMQTYLSELLTDDTEVGPVVENDSLQKLLQNVSADVNSAGKITTQKPQYQVAEIDVKNTTALNMPIETINTELNQELLVTRKSNAIKKSATEKSYRKSDFQAMFFEVAGLTIAVPLIELGGIYPADKTNSLMGKPDWFKGVMLYRDEKINVVDTALWVMPEKCNESLKQSLNYQYIIMLNDSRWGLSAEHLVDTVTLSQDDVKWLDSPSKRPWLAGLVKDRMCALLDVDALIQLLNDGSGINTEI